MDCTVAMFFWDPEGHDLPLIVIEPQEISSEDLVKIDLEFATILAQEYRLRRGLAPDRCYEDPDIKKEYQELSEEIISEIWCPLHCLEGKEAILEFLDTWDEFEGVTEDNLCTFFSEHPDLREQLSLPDPKSLFTDKYSDVDLSLGFSKVPDTIAKLI